MSNWEQYELESKITTILRGFHYNQPDNFGQPFASPYQIAIAFAENYPELFRKLGYPIGGLGAGGYSLAQYIAHELSERVKSKRITHIEGAWLQNDYVRQLEFVHEGKVIIASGTIEASLSMFRLRPSQ